MYTQEFYAYNIFNSHALTFVLSNVLFFLIHEVNHHISPQFWSCINFVNFKPINWQNYFISQLQLKHTWSICSVHFADSVLMQRPALLSTMSFNIAKHCKAPRLNTAAATNVLIIKYQKFDTYGANFWLPPLLVQPYMWKLGKNHVSVARHIIARVWQNSDRSSWYLCEINYLLARLKIPQLKLIMVSSVKYPPPPLPSL
jgi:hypothetical protein